MRVRASSLRWDIVAPPQLLSEDILRPPALGCNLGMAALKTDVLPDGPAARGAPTSWGVYRSGEDNSHRTSRWSVGCCLRTTPTALRSMRPWFRRRPRGFGGGDFRWRRVGCRRGWRWGR